VFVTNSCVCHQKWWRATYHLTLRISAFFLDTSWLQKEVTEADTQADMSAVENRLKATLY